MSKEVLNKIGIEEAKKNGFILVGKTGTGKTTLLNAIFGKEVGIVGKTSASGTQKCEIFYYRLENGKYACFIDTPGLNDTDSIINEEIDNIHLMDIRKTISKNKIHIKGILFLVNFQIERFDASEQIALLKYNEVFPLKKFWSHLILIYTHYYGDPDGEKKEEIKILRNKSNSQELSKLMSLINNVSEPIQYNDLRIKFFNSFSPAVKDKHIQMNKIVREELEFELNDLILKKDLFSKIEVIFAKNIKTKDKKTGKTYLTDAEIIQTYDFNEKPLEETMNIISKKEMDENDNEEHNTEYDVQVLNAKRDKTNKLKHNIEKGNEENSNFLKSLPKTLSGALVSLGVALSDKSPIISKVLIFGGSLLSLWDRFSS